MNETNSGPPVFRGVWRTETAAIDFRNDGTYVTLHSPSHGTFTVIRDTEWTRETLSSQTGYLLVVRYLPPLHGGVVYLIESFTEMTAVLCRPDHRADHDPFTIRKDLETSH
jgi:hypothetical protein